MLLLALMLGRLLLHVLLWRRARLRGKRRCGVLKPRYLRSERSTERSLHRRSRCRLTGSFRRCRIESIHAVVTSVAFTFVALRLMGGHSSSLGYVVTVIACDDIDDVIAKDHRAGYSSGRSGDTTSDLGRFGETALDWGSGRWRSGATAVAVERSSCGARGGGNGISGCAGGRRWLVTHWGLLRDGRWRSGSSDQYGCGELGASSDVGRPDSGAKCNDSLWVTAIQHGTAEVSRDHFGRERGSRGAPSEHDSA